MASYQYIYTMQGLTKAYPGGKEVLKNIHLSYLPGAKIGVGFVQTGHVGRKHVVRPIALGDFDVDHAHRRLTEWKPRAFENDLVLLEDRVLGKHQRAAIH